MANIAPVHFPLSVTVADVLAVLDAERQRYWHTKHGDGGRVRDPKATQGCHDCAAAHRVLDAPSKLRSGRYRRPE